MDETPTNRQVSIPRFIIGYIRKESRSPSVREMMKGSGLASTGAISYQLKALKG